MKRSTPRTRLATSVSLALLSMAAPCGAAEYWLKAAATTATMPDGASVPMWAYARCTDATFSTCDPATVPGPALVVPPGEGLTVSVRNELPEPTSLVIAGQVTAMTPVWTDGSVGPRPSATARVRSFTHEAAPGGGTATYSWPIVKPGTYLYHSGTHPQVQVQMGLYGASTKDVAAGLAYPGVAYDDQVTLLYSEIDPALHMAVAGPAPSYGTAAGPTSTLDYFPKYFLVNGKPYSAGAPPIGNAQVGKTTLLRFINAGLQTHVPVVYGPYLRMIAEDGNPYPWGGNPRQRYSVFLPPAKTTDATFVASPGTAPTIAIFDRSLGLTNASGTDGGMLAFLSVGDVGSPPTITSTPVTTATQGQPYGYTVTATDPDGGALAYSLTSAPAGMTIGASSGAIAWTPSIGQLGPNAVTVRVTDPTARFATQSFSIDVLADATTHAPTIDSTPVTNATYGQAYTYQVAASDVDGGTLAYSLDAAPVGMAINGATGLISWTPSKADVGSASVTVRVTDPSTLFATQTYAITVADANYPPVAANDAYGMVQGGTLAVSAPGVLANDTDSDGDALTAVLGTAPASGTLSLAADGSFTYVPAAATTGAVTFTYVARDTLASTSNVATVTVNIAADRAPLAADDVFSAPRRTNAPYTAVTLGVLLNDSDPDTALDPTNTIDVATVSITTPPNKGGAATVNPDGSITYTPARNFKGTEDFRYTVRDTRGAVSNAAQVRVNVK